MASNFFLFSIFHLIVANVCFVYIEALNFLWISDIHYDPFYDREASVSSFCHKNDDIPLEKSLFNLHINSNTAFHKAGMELRRLNSANWQSETNPALGRAGCDTSTLLFDTTIQYINDQFGKNTLYKASNEGISAILLTGDFVAHFRDEDVAEKKHSLRLAAEKLSTILSTERDNIQYLISIGNNDLKKDYLYPKERSKWSEFLLNIFEPLIDLSDEGKITFRKGLYYSTNLKSDSSIKVLLLNTVLYSKNLRKELGIISEPHYLGDGVDADYSRKDWHDPAEQFAWLEKELLQARTNNQQVIIAGHISPGISIITQSALSVSDQWVDQYALRYRDIVLPYSDIIISQLFGHQHADLVKLLQPSTHLVSGLDHDALNCNTAKPLEPLPILLAPSISPVHGNNPAFRTVKFERRSTVRVPSEDATNHYVLNDYTQFSLPLYGYIPSKQKGNNLGSYLLEYSFQRTYKQLLKSYLEEQTLNHNEPKTFATCINWSLVSLLLKGVLESPFIYAIYDFHMYSGGKRITNKMHWCESNSISEEGVLECLAK